MLKTFILKIIANYQKINFIWRSTPLLFGASQCRYYPTCSDYATIVIKNDGLISGSIKSIKRILRCNPLSKGGLDLP